MKEEPAITEELLTRWIDGVATAEENTHIESRSARHPALETERRAAMSLGNLLREHLPSSQEPPSADFFTSSVMSEIRRTSAVPPLRRSGTSWLERLRAPWFAPVASAALVAAGFMLWNTRHQQGAATAASNLYAPDPRVVATSYFSEEAGATVIDLDNLDALPNDREVRAFDIANSEPPAPGQPHVLFAAARPGEAVMVLSKDGREVPRISILH